jgi:hypothetical protein
MNFLVVLGLLFGIALSLTMSTVPQANAAANVGSAASYCQRAYECLAKKRKGKCKELQRLCDKEMKAPEPK